MLRPHISKDLNIHSEGKIFFLHIFNLHTMVIKFAHITYTFWATVLARWPFKDFWSPQGQNEPQLKTLIARRWMEIMIWNFQVWLASIYVKFFKKNFWIFQKFSFTNFWKRICLHFGQYGNLRTNFFSIFFISLICHDETDVLHPNLWWATKNWPIYRPVYEILVPKIVTKSKIRP